jgi:hypothetical protein
MSAYPLPLSTPSQGNAPHRAPSLPPVQGLAFPRSPSRLSLALLIAAILLLSFLFQWPANQAADWKLYTLYDPGTILKGDLLLAKGYIPTVDFGYTHGLIPLLYGRVGFALFGRTPWTFLGLTFLTELAMAWALARILIATGLAASRASLAFVLIGLPMAIMPAYLTLTHPLEAMLILLAFAAQVEGNKPRSLLLMTVCLFVKPSMAYVYGLVLLLLIAWEHRKRPSRILGELLPAATALLLLLALFGARFGLPPVIHTLLPLTGAKTYASTNFGFFKESGRNFWLLPPAAWWQYLFAPPGIFLIAALACALGAFLGAARLLMRPANLHPAPLPLRQRAWELLFTIGALHTAFLAGFYGWTGSWTYYSYMPVLGLALFTLLMLRPRARRLFTFWILAVLMLLSHLFLVGFTTHAWLNKSPRGDGPGAAPGLWRYPSEFADWKAVTHAVGNRPTLIMTNGFLFDLPPTMQMPDAWFPEPGIPTPSEIARVQRQVDHVDFVVLVNEYGEDAHHQHPDLRLWAFPQFAPQRAEFQPFQQNEIFTILQRTAPAAPISRPPTSKQSP